MQPHVNQWLFEQLLPQHLELLNLSNPPKKCKLDLSNSTKGKFDTMADGNDNDDDQKVQLQLEKFMSFQYDPYFDWIP